MSVLVASFVDATVMLAAGLVLASLLRRRSAALRHGILATAISCAALTPVFEVTVPQLPVVRWFEPAGTRSSGLAFGSEDTTISPAVVSAALPSPGIDWPTLLGGAWVVASLATFLSVALGLLRLRRLTIACVPASGRWSDLATTLAAESGINRRVRLLQSDHPGLLVTYGVVRPRILLPAGAGEWAADRQVVVLRHELAHIRRNDAAVQMIGEVLRIVQPFNPLVWIACRRLRQESEYACDDAVLSAGVKPTDYASHLFDIAARLSGHQRIWATAPAVAHPSTLERRIVAMLHQQKDRQPLSRTGWTVVAVMAVALSLPLAAIGIAPPPAPEPMIPLTSPASAPAGRIVGLSDAPLRVLPAPPESKPKAVAQTSFSGFIQDETGGRIPGVAVTLSGQQGPLTAVTDASGAFRFANLSPGLYQLTAQMVGFRKVVSQIDLSSGAPVILTLTMPIGALSEAISVRCSSASSSILDFFFPSLSAQDQPATPIRIGGSVVPPKKTRDVRPACPEGGVTGTVVVIAEGRIGSTGLVTSLKPVNPDRVPARFTDAVLEAVRQWEFTPTKLNGVPVEVTFTVTVNYSGA